MPSKNTLNISLTKRLENFVMSRVQSGRYGSASEVVRDALRLLEDKEYEREAGLKSVKHKIAEGMAAVRAGRVSDGEAFFKGLEDQRTSKRIRKSA